MNHIRYLQTASIALTIGLLFLSPFSRASAPEEQENKFFRPAIDRALREYAKRPADMTPVEIKEAVEQALRSHPDGKIAEIQVKGAKEQRKKARSGFFPQIDLFSAMGEEQGAYPFPSRFGYGEFGVQLSLQVWDWGATRFDTKSALTRIQASQQRLIGTRVGLGLQAANIFLLVLRERVNRVYAENNLQLHQNLLSILEKFGPNAQATDLSLLRARTAQASSALEESRELAERAEIEYERIIGIDPIKYWLVRPSWTDYPKDQEPTIQLAFENNPQLLALSKGIESSSLDLKTVTARYRPKISAFARASERTGLGSAENVPAPHGLDPAYSVGLQLNFPLFTGGKRSADLNQARLNIETANLLLEKAKRDTRADIRKIYLALARRSERIVFLDKSVEDSLKSITKLTEICTSTPPAGAQVQNLLDQLRDLFQSSLSLNSEAWGFLSDVYALEAQTGKLLETLQVSSDFTRP